MNGERKSKVIRNVRELLELVMYKDDLESPILAQVYAICCIKRGNNIHQEVVDAVLEHSQGKSDARKLSELFSTWNDRVTYRDNEINRRVFSANVRREIINTSYSKSRLNFMSNFDRGISEMESEENFQIVDSRYSELQKLDQ
jgi:hypothetical protein